MMRKLDIKVAALAVIALCLAVNVALAALAPQAGPRSGEEAAPTAADPAGDEQAPQADISLDEGSVPVPDEMPEGTRPADLRAAVAEAADASGLSDLEDIEIADSGVSGAADGSGPSRWWWVYEGTTARGEEASLTVGYGLDIGWYAGVQ